MLTLESIQSVQIELTGHCNAKCPQCGRFDIFGQVRKDLPIQHLDIQVIDAIPVEKMKKLDRVIFNGNFGEPLLHPKIDLIIKKFKDIRIDISTNGSLRNSKWWGELGKNYKNISITFGIDGLENTHHLYRRNTDFKKILKNAESFIQNGGNAIWQFIIFKHNQHEVDAAREISKKIGFSDIKFMYSDRFLKGKTTTVYGKDKEPKYVLEKASEQKTIHELTNSEEGNFYTKRLFKDNLYKSIECPWAKKQKIFISHTGLLLPCCFMANITSGKQIYKKLFEKIVKSLDKINLRRNNLEKIMNSDVYKKLLPYSLETRPHPNCIEHCSKTLSKSKLRSEEELILNT